LQVQAQKLEAQLSASSVEFRTQIQPVTLRQVQQAIPPQAALVEVVAYQPFNPRAPKREEVWGAPRYVAYVLHQDGEPAWVDLGDAAAIDQGVTQLRTALGNPSRADVQTLPRALAEPVTPPLPPPLGAAPLIPPPPT